MVNITYFIFYYIISLYCTLRDKRNFVAFICLAHILELTIKLDFDSEVATCKWFS